jgi:hypothetical protein
MERQARVASNALLAMVVREFSPSRIERQLLTHVFEYVVTVHRADNSEQDKFNNDQPPCEQSVDTEDSSTTLGTRNAA